MLIFCHPLFLLFAPFLMSCLHLLDHLLIFAPWQTQKKRKRRKWGVGDFFFWGEITYARCHVVKSSRGVCRHPKASQHWESAREKKREREALITCTLALTQRQGLNAHSYRCCEGREASEIQVKKGNKKDIWRKDGTAGVQVGWRQKAQVSLQHTHMHALTPFSSLNLLGIM